MSGPGRSSDGGNQTGFKQVPMKNKNHKKQPEVCLCGSGVGFPDCCGRYHAGESAPDPQSLMRSRYSAYARHLENYLLDTWYASTRPAQLELDVSIKWIGLEILSFSDCGEEGWVEFVARYKINGRAGRMREKSHFVRENGRWYYVDGVEPVAD